MNIIISFLIGASILYVGFSTLVYLTVEEMRLVPKVLRLGAWVGSKLMILAGIALLSIIAYCIGTEILK